MPGLGALIVGTLFAGSAIKKAVDNADAMSTPIDVVNGVKIYRNIDGNYVINGEKCYSDRYKDHDGYEHFRYVGLKSGKVYCDSLTETEKRRKAEKTREDKTLKENGKKACMKYHVGNHFNVSDKGNYITELNTGKVIVRLERDKKGNCKKYYAIGNSPIEWLYKETGWSEGIPISFEEFESLDLRGTHSGGWCSSFCGKTQIEDWYK